MLKFLENCQQTSFYKKVIVCPYFFRNPCSISPKNSNNSVAGDAHHCFISKNNILPKGEWLLEHIYTPFWTREPAFLLKTGFLQHFLIKRHIFENSSNCTSGNWMVAREKLDAAGYLQIWKKKRKNAFPG